MNYEKKNNFKIPCKGAHKKMGSAGGQVKEWKLQQLLMWTLKPMSPMGPVLTCKEVGSHCE